MKTSNLAWQCCDEQYCFVCLELVSKDLDLTLLCTVRITAFHIEVSLQRPLVGM